MFLDEPRKRPLRHTPLTRNDSQALRLKPTNGGFGMAFRKKYGPAEMLAALPCGLDPAPLAFAEQFPLELGQASHHGEYETAGRRASVDPEIENAEMNATFLQVFDQQQNIRRGPTEATDLRDRERVTEREAFDHFIKKRSLPDAGYFFDHDAGGPCTTQSIDLSILGLIGRGNAGISHEIDGNVIIHPATLFCHLPFVTNKVKPLPRSMNSGKRYTL